MNVLQGNILCHDHNFALVFIVIIFMTFAFFFAGTHEIPGPSATPGIPIL